MVAFPLPLMEAGGNFSQIFTVRTWWSTEIKLTEVWGPLPPLLDPSGVSNSQTLLFQSSSSSSIYSLGLPALALIPVEVGTCWLVYFGKL